MNDRSRRTPVSLLPLFRSEAQYRLVGELYTRPRVELTVSQLAERIHASHPTVSREVARLEEAGLLRSRREGNRTLVTAADTTPVFDDLRRLMAKVYGAPAVIADEFSALGARVSIFGSWAARWHGEPGPTPHDIDVLVVGQAPPSDAWAAAAAASRRLGIEVNVTVRTPEEWADDDSGFAATVAQRPQILLVGAEPEPPASPVDDEDQDNEQQAPTGRWG